MSVLVDTPLWSLAYRRKQGRLNPEESDATAVLAKLISGKRARIIGPIRQEILSGIAEPHSFNRLRELLRAFDDEPLHMDDYEVAAQSAHRCRSVGIATTSVDMLICAVAIRRKWTVYTTDRDFHRYSRALTFEVFQNL